MTCDEIDWTLKSASATTGNIHGNRQQTRSEEGKEEEEDIYTSDDLRGRGPAKAATTTTLTGPVLDDLRSQNIIKQTTKACPSCGGRIEKAGGWYVYCIMSLPPETLAVQSSTNQIHGPSSAQ